MMRRWFVMLLALLFLVAIPASAFAAYDQANTKPTTNNPAPAVKFTPKLQDGDTKDNGFGNANNTGQNIEKEPGDPAAVGYDVYGIVKSKDMRMNNFTTKATQRTHGEYQNNTNSCATCHQTHTGAGKDLLLKAGVYNSCSACHDGTLGFYNVFKSSSAGTFGGDTGMNASVHLANGTVSIGMAPGFNDYSGGNQVANYTFDCAGCHAPHGSYSDRLLHYSPNGMADVDITKKGNKLVGYTVAATAPVANATSPEYVVYRGASSKTVTDLVYVPQEPIGTPVIVVLKKEGNGTTIPYSYKRDATPWVAGIEHRNTTYNTYVLNFTQLYNAAGKAITEDVNQDGSITAQDRQLLDIRYGKAYAKGTSIANVITADIARAYVVKLSGITGMEPGLITDFGGVKITKINPDIYDENGIGKAISNYCGACHTDYNTHSERDTMAIVFRHSTDKDRFNCLKCHFAHGTDVTIMKDARDRDLKYLTTDANGPKISVTDATYYLMDKNPSSALKRYTNMAVCWKCHSAVSGKSSKLMNNDYYWDTYADNPQGGYNPATGITPEQNWTYNSWE